MTGNQEVEGDLDCFGGGRAGGCGEGAEGTCGSAGNVKKSGRRRGREKVQERGIGGESAREGRGEVDEEVSGDAGTLAEAGVEGPFGRWWEALQRKKVGDRHRVSIPTYRGGGRGKDRSAGQRLRAPSREARRASLAKEAGFR